MRIGVACLASVLLSCLLVAGCKVHPQEPVGTGIYSYMSGRLAWTYPVTMNSAWEAALQALETLDIKVQSKTFDGLGGQIAAVRADQTKIWLEFKPVSAHASRISIKVGSFGSREQAAKIHKAIQTKLSL